MAYVACPSCRFLVGPDDTTCRWCNLDLLARQEQDARAAAIGATEAPESKRRSGRRLPPPPAPEPVALSHHVAHPSTGEPLPPPPPLVLTRRASAPAARATLTPSPAPVALATAPRAIPEPEAATPHRWRGRIAAIGIAASLAVLGGTVGILILRPSDQSIASSKPSTTFVTAPGDPVGTWVAYTAPDGTFVVKFPAPPTTRDDKVPDGALPERMYVADPAGVFVSNLPLTLDASQLDALFASSIDGGLALLRTRATVQGQTPTRVLGLPAQEITLRVNGKTSYATFVLTRHRVLLLMTDVPDVALHHAFVATLELPNG